jgi:prepilin peptidase CpaA
MDTRIETYFFIIKAAILAVLLTCSVIGDLRASKIPNRATFFGIICGVAVNLAEAAVVFGSGAATASASAATTTATGVALTLSGTAVGALLDAFLAVVFSILIPFISLVVLYMAKMLGAGDIKLLMAIGAVAGSLFVVEIMAFSFLAGGLFSLIILIVDGRLVACAKRFVSYIKACVILQKLLPYPNLSGIGEMSGAEEVGDAGAIGEAGEASDAREANIVITRFPKIFRSGGMIRFSLAIAAGSIVFVLLNICQNVLQM